MIREIRYDELKSASNVLWKSFYEAEKNNHTMEGMELFRDLTDPVSLSINTFDGSVVLYGYFENENLLAVGALKDKHHVLMLYVFPDEQKKGIGCHLLDFMEKLCEGGNITLNSSDSAISFYEKYGYRVVGKRTTKDGLIGTPMQKDL